MFGRPLSRHQVLSLSIGRGCGMTGRPIVLKSCTSVRPSVDSRVSLQFKGNKGGSYEEERVFP